MYREEIKVLDCTVRDGGLMNKWQFSDAFVRAVYTACVESGIDYMEIGYKSSENAYSRKENGAWKFCEEKDLRRIMGNNDTNLKISAMCDIGRIDDDDIQIKSESLIDMMRVACYVTQVDKAIHLAEHCMDKGYEATINLMAVSTVMERDLDEALNDLSKCKVPVVYLVDSFGSMYCEQIDLLANKYHTALPNKTLGIHAHNNMQLAFSNTITSIINNINMLDCTMLGLGRGAGNCCTELLLSFLKNPKYKLNPIFKVIQEYLAPMQKDIDWGYHIPYLISGANNLHPKSAMEWMESEKKHDIVTFYNKTIDFKEL